MLEKLRPLGDRVLVKRKNTGQEQTASGLFIPEAAREKPQSGTVMAVGSGRRTKDGALVPLEVKVNDIVYFSKYAGLDDDEYVVLREDEIFGVIER